MTKPCQFAFTGHMIDIEGNSVVWITALFVTLACRLMPRIFQGWRVWNVLSRHSWCLYVVQAPQMYKSVLRTHAWSWQTDAHWATPCLAALPIFLPISLSKEGLVDTVDKFLQTLKPFVIKQNLTRVRGALRKGDSLFHTNCQRDSFTSVVEPVDDFLLSAQPEQHNLQTGILCSLCAILKY